MEQNKKKLSGVFSPVVTPFRSDKPALDDLRFNLKKLNESDLTGYLALGSNAEFRSLNDKEQIQVLEVFAEEKGDKIVMVGTGCESSRQTIEKSKIVGKMGFDYVSVLTPCYFAKQINGDVLKSYYERIADSIDIPVLLYNAPGFTGGIRIPPTTVLELSRHLNIVGMKDSSPEGPAKLLAHLDPKEDFHVLAGSANFFYPCLHLGIPGGVISITNALPDPCCGLYRLFTEGRYNQARDLHFKLARLNQAVSGTWGVAGVKTAMDLMGFKGGSPRHPLKAVTNEGIEEIRRQIINEGFMTE
ncbi:MAG: dihydrodipicolinate synthase family protein [Sedimentisphaerales bacterium]|nr:dihydrodipicolinate synthase family protein [Sedimentisphaerales bacterium]